MEEIGAKGRHEQSLWGKSNFSLIIVNAGIVQKENGDVEASLQESGDGILRPFNKDGSVSPRKNKGEKSCGGSDDGTQCLINVYVTEEGKKQEMTRISSLEAYVEKLPKGSKLSVGTNGN